MNKRDTLDRLSLVLLGIAVGLVLGGLVQAVQIPMWVIVLVVVSTLWAVLDDLPARLG